MKCLTCKHYWNMLPCMDSPYGEEACMKTEQDLWGCEPEDVVDCEHFEPKVEWCPCPIQEVCICGKNNP